MDRQTKISILFIIALLLPGALALASCGGDQEEIVRPAPEEEQVAPPVLDGQTLVEERCTRCHNLERTTNARKTAQEWQATVERMVSKGADLSLAEQEVVIQYLVETYPE